MSIWTMEISTAVECKKCCFTTKCKKVLLYFVSQKIAPRIIDIMPS